MSVAVQNVKDMETVIKDPNKIDTNGSLHNNWNDPYKQFVSTLFFGELQSFFFMASHI